MLTSYPTPPVSTMAWLGCFSIRMPRRRAIIWVSSSLPQYNIPVARRRFFVDRISGGAAELRGDEARHLTRVLRVEPGQRFEISDNHRAYLAEIQEARGERVLFRVVEPVDSTPL